MDQTYKGTINDDEVKIRKAGDYVLYIRYHLYGQGCST